MENDFEKLKPYPTWVCVNCAWKAGAMLPKNHAATLHNDICDVCGREVAVTESRDYGYPKFKGHEGKWIDIKEAGKVDVETVEKAARYMTAPRSKPQDLHIYFAGETKEEQIANAKKFIEEYERVKNGGWIDGW